MISVAVPGTEPQAAGERRIIVMIGAPGAGKGTQAERLAEALGLPRISTGELFRAALRDGGPLEGKVRKYVEKGVLVPDDLVIDIVGRRLAEPDAAEGAILDGFPRTRAQAVALDEMLTRAKARVSAALYVEVAPELLLERLTGRRICSLDEGHVYHVTSRPPRVPGICDIDGAELYQRDDDSPATVRSRLETQLPPMYEVIDHYCEADVLFGVRGEASAEEVTEDLLQALASAARSG